MNDDDDYISTLVTLDMLEDPDEPGLYPLEAMSRRLEAYFVKSGLPTYRRELRPGVEPTYEVTFVPSRVTLGPSATGNPQQKRLFYRASPANGGLVFATPARAEAISQIHNALENSKTWGEFRRAMPEGEYRSFAAQTYSQDPDEPEAIPDDDEVFDCGRIPEYNDGDYPPWLQPEMDLLLPEDLLDSYADVTTTAFNGSYFHIEQDREREFVEQLRRRGFEVEKRKDLMFF